MKPCIQISDSRFRGKINVVSLCRIAGFSHVKREVKSIPLTRASPLHLFSLALYLCKLHQSWMSSNILRDTVRCHCLKRSSDRRKPIEGEVFEKRTFYNPAVAAFYSCCL